MVGIRVFLLSIFSVVLGATDVHAQTIVSGSEGQTYHTGFLGHRETDGFGAVHFSPSSTPEVLPAEYDLRTLGHVAAIKDQKSCGSCWAFAITGSLESARMRAGLPETDLSEQEMVSCEREAYGCQGGFMDSADYVVASGLTLESTWPYTNTTGTCRSPLPARAEKAKSWAYVGGAGRKPTIDEMKTALMEYGVLFVTVSAGGTDWDGRPVLSRCTNRQANHMVNIVGWTRDNKWIVKNSWGTQWGDDGYATAPFGCDNLANEANSAAFVVYEGGGPCTPPKVRLPGELTVVLGTEIMLGVRPQTGVTYEWFSGGVSVGTGSTLFITPEGSAAYTLKAKNNCGQAESSVNVRVIAGLL